MLTSNIIYKIETINHFISLSILSRAPAVHGVSLERHGPRGAVQSAETYLEIKSTNHINNLSIVFSAPSVLGVTIVLHVI